MGPKSEFPKVYRVPARFMQLPRDHVNAFIVETRNSVVVIDTGLASSSARDLREKAESFGKPIEAVLLTHGHPDHYTGLWAFADLPRIASRGCLEFAHREDIEKAPTATSYLGDDYPVERLFPDQIIDDGTVFTLGGVRFIFRDYGPGESDSDGVWYFEKDGLKHVFVGDLVARECHSFFHDGHVLEWMSILDRLEKDFDRNTILYIGHGETPATIESVAWQRDYNNVFIDAVRNIKTGSAPASEADQQRVIEAVKRFLPYDATLFLLAYDLGGAIDKLRGILDK